jgi:hypothetical protein
VSRCLKFSSSVMPAKAVRVGERERYFITNGYYVLYRPATNDLVAACKSGRAWFTSWDLREDIWYLMDGSPFKHGWEMIGDL